MTPEAAEKKYWAFISYSSKDRKWGRRLHNRLENYPIPKEFQGTKIFDGSVLGKNLRPIFRDRDELSGASNLGDAILEALQESRFLIVLCSPNSARSQWVDQEIKDFIAISGEKNILALILNGEPNASSPETDFDDSLECFPPSLRYPVEPLAGDLRKEGDGKERGFLKILAGISQLDFDVLYRRHERAQRSRVIAWGAAAAIIIAALAGLSIFSIKKSREQQVLLDNVALADHDSALQASEQGRYRESAAYYARSLSIRPENTTVAHSAVSSAIMADTLFAKQRHILKVEDKIISLLLHPGEDVLHVITRGKPLTLSLTGGLKDEATPGANWQEIQQPALEEVVDDFPWLADSVAGLSVAVVSPDGTKLFAGTATGKIHRFDIATRTDEWAKLAKQRKNLISGISVSPCGETLAAADWDSSLTLIDADSGALQDSIQFAYNVERLFYSKNGYFLIAASEDGFVRVFDTGASPLVMKSTLLNPGTFPIQKEDTKARYILSDQGNLSVIESGSQKILKSGISLPQPAEKIAVSPDGKFLVAGNRMGYLMILSLETGALHSTRRSARITDIKISPDSTICYASSWDRYLIAYDLEKGEEKWKQAFKGYVNEISLSYDGKLIAAASDDFTFRIFDSSSGKSVWSSLTDNCVKHISFQREQLLAATVDHLFDLDCSHLFRETTDGRGDLAVYLVTHAALRIHELTPVRSARHERMGDNIRKILDWRNEHPAKRTRSPFSGVVLSQLVSKRLGDGPREDAIQLHRLAPWHPLTPVSIALLPENDENPIRQRHLCEMTVDRLRGIEDTEQDRTVAARWMLQRGFVDLAEEVAGKK